jgi:hypothetical protein
MSNNFMYTSVMSFTRAYCTYVVLLCIAASIYNTKETRRRRITVTSSLKGLSHEIDFKNVDENGQILALLRAAAGF